MRCYFIRNKWIEAVYMLKPGSDEDLVRQAKELFEQNAGPNMHGFEVWFGRPFVYRWPPGLETKRAVASGQRALERLFAPMALNRRTTRLRRATAFSLGDDLCLRSISSGTFRSALISTASSGRS